VWAIIPGSARPPFKIVTTAERYAAAWTSGLAKVSVFQNVKGIIGGGGGGSEAGICTKMAFYENAVNRIACEPRTACLTGGASGHGSEDDYINGLTTRWIVELGNEICGVSLIDANDMIQTLFKHQMINEGTPVWPEVP
jgi:hypothetical protein